MPAIDEGIAATIADNKALMPLDIHESPALIFWIKKTAVPVVKNASVHTSGVASIPVDILAPKKILSRNKIAPPLIGDSQVCLRLEATSSAGGSIGSDCEHCERSCIIAFPFSCAPLAPLPQEAVSMGLKAQAPALDLRGAATVDLRPQR